MTAARRRTSLVLATRNPGKARELLALLAGLPLDVLSAADFPGLPEVEEDGETLEANAAKKAQLVAGWTGKAALADDTGLFVDGLGGAPGVQTARFAGPQANDAANRAKLLAALAGAPPAARRAVFRTAVALALPGGAVYTAEGSCEGRITAAERGRGGFGYDPVFEVAGTGKTYAEMSLEEKNRVSHRAVALAAARRLIERHLLGGEMWYYT